MLTLDEIKVQLEKGHINLVLRYRPEIGTAKAEKIKGWNQPSGLTNAQVDEVLSKKQLTIFHNGENTIFDIEKEGSLAVSIEVRSHSVKRSEWEKFKKKMREAGFSYRSESPWFHCYSKGKWEWNL